MKVIMSLLRFIQEQPFLQLVSSNLALLRRGEESTSLPYCYLFITFKSLGSGQSPEAKRNIVATRELPDVRKRFLSHDALFWS